MGEVVDISNFNLIDQLDGAMKEFPGCGKICFEDDKVLLRKVENEPDDQCNNGRVIYCSSKGTSLRQIYDTAVAENCLAKTELPTGVFYESKKENIVFFLKTLRNGQEVSILMNKVVAGQNVVSYFANSRLNIGNVLRMPRIYDKSQKKYINLGMLIECGMNLAQAEREVANQKQLHHICGRWDCLVNLMENLTQVQHHTRGGNNSRRVIVDIKDYDTFEKFYDYAVQMSKFH